MSSKWYVGYRREVPALRGNSVIREAFKADREPTEASHGDRYYMACGPFRTMRGARWATGFSAHWSTIAEAERATRKMSSC